MHSVLVALAPALILAGVYGIVLSRSGRSDVYVRTFLVRTLQLLWVRYGLWRCYTIFVTCQLTASWLLSAAFLVAEMIGLVFGIRQMSVMRFFRSNSTKADQSRGWWSEQEGGGPLIDVLVPTYNENERILRRTLVGALGIDYPRFRVWVLDDGKRDWLETLARRKGVNYLRRDSNEHYKAGNLNSAIERLLAHEAPPQFVAVFDADFIALPSFLERTLALMNDAKVAVVQTPQYFYNPDPFQYVFRAERAWPDDQRSWFDARLPALEGVEAATCCGTSCLIRVSALEEVGRFPTESVSEDTLLSMKLRRAGYRTTYLNEVLSVGLAPEGLSEFLTQRVRWCLGSLQIALSRTWGPRSNRNKPLGWLYFLEAFLRQVWPLAMKIAWMASMPLMLLFGVFLMRSSLTDFCSYIAPVLVARFGMTWLNRGTFMPLIGDAVSLTLAPSIIETVFRVARGRQDERFSVTKKGTNRRQFTLHEKPARVPLVLLALTIVSVIYAALTPHSALNTTGARGMIYVWTALNILVLVAALAPCVEPPKHRQSERFACDLQVSLSTARGHAHGRITDLSEDGCQLQAEAIAPGERFSLMLPNVGRLDCEAKRQAGGGRLGIAFHLSESERAALIRQLYCSGRFIRPITDWSFWASFGALCRYLMRT